jgi:hypothetical protein
MESNGGTQLWCPNCKEIRECKVVSHWKTDIGNFNHPEFPDLNWRQRPRICLECDTEFNTIEIQEEAVDELVELRRLMKRIKEAISVQEQYPTRPSKSINGKIEGVEN